MDSADVWSGFKMGSGFLQSLQVYTGFVPSHTRFAGQLVRLSTDSCTSLPEAHLWRALFR